MMFSELFERLSPEDKEKFLDALKSVDLDVAGVEGLFHLKFVLEA